MKIINYPSESEWPALLERPVYDTTQLNEIVSGVLQSIKSRGDEAVREFELKFDQVELKDLQVSESEFTDAESIVPDELKQAIKLAKQNITAFHAAQDVPLPKLKPFPA